VTTAQPTLSLPSLSSASRRVTPSWETPVSILLAVGGVGASIGALVRRQ
jgi:hypothetical protein